MEKYNLKDFFKNNIDKIVYTSNNVNETIDLSFEIAKFLKVTDVIVLNGELGSGKTVFMQGIAKHFGIQDEVSSPTFTIVNEYIARDINIYHFDVYRLEDENQFIDTIGTEYFENGISIIEWGNIIKNILPKSAIYVDISKIDENKREICIRRENKWTF